MLVKPSTQKTGLCSFVHNFLILQSLFLLNMYKFSLVLLVVPFFIALLTTSCKPTPDEYRRDFVKGCVNRYAKDSTVANTEGRLMVEDYCNCLGDKLSGRLKDVESWRQFNKSADTTLAEFQGVFEPCIETFSNNLSKLKK